MSELWDDSALLSAFDNAISKYKIMHGKQNCDNSTEKEKVVSHNTECIPAAGNEGPEETRRTEEVDNENVEFKSPMNAGVPNDLASFEDYHHTNSGAPETDTHTSNVSQMQETQDYRESEGVDEYNVILNQYYELEAQRQKVLQQLQQVGYWNYSFPGECCSSSAQWGTYPSITEAHQDPKQQAYNPAAIPSCCPYVCPCLAAPCPSVLACPFSQSCDSQTSTDSAAVLSTKGPGNVPPLADERVVKTAMKAAERAISSMKKKGSITSNLNEDKGKEKKDISGLLEGEMGESIGSETDLTVVLNAWYSAGFFTGKYLLEQSMRKDGMNKQYL